MMPACPFSASGRIAGIDYGHVRIGIAVSDPGRVIASPLETYVRRGETLDAERFRSLVAEEQIVGFVVGLPVHGSGEESAKSQEARRFGRWLSETTSLPVCYFDERFTSVFADRLLWDSKLTAKKRKQRRDALAAQILLGAFLESSTTADASVEPLDD
jgi:putative Holliday junction resolvase